MQYPFLTKFSNLLSLIKESYEDILDTSEKHILQKKKDARE